jgi:type I restriction enzyme S subunit
MTTDKHNKRPNVPPLRFPEFSGEWNRTSIGDKFELYSGNTPSRLVKDQFVGKINWITSGELKNHYIAATNETITEEAAANNNLRLLPIGTFVIAIYGLEAAGVRSTGSITTEASTISQACMAFLPKGEISNEFLYSWYMKHGNTIGLRYAQGTKQQNLSYDIIERFKISYPNVLEQRKLEKFISLLDRRIATQSGLINKLESLISGITLSVVKSDDCESIQLTEILTERNEVNTAQYEVYSVSVSQGVVNQVEYLGRSFAAKDTSNYNVVHYGDIVYTKSPTGDFPYGIVKRSDQTNPVAVSPLYGVYTPASNDIGCFLHYYFCNAISTKNYLHKLIQKGAKNTINITNQRFLENIIKVPNAESLAIVVKLLNQLSVKKQRAEELLALYRKQKQYLLSQMFI